MAPETLQYVSTITASLAMLAAILSGVCAFLSYQLMRKIQNELKSDERIVHGTPTHPVLPNSAHSAPVIQCTLFNKSKRKAYVNAVSVYDQVGTKIDVTWSDQIDQLGNPQNPCKLVGIVDACQLFIREINGGGMDYARIAISHSFSAAPMEVIFDPTADWINTPNG